MTKTNDDSHKSAKVTPKHSVTSIAKRRWKILAKALCNRSSSSSFDEYETENNISLTATTPATATVNQTNVTLSDDYLASVRRFTCFSLFERNPFIVRNGENWFVYRTSIENREYSLVIRELSQKFTPEDLIGFNNTGNICIWPSEEALAYHVLHHLPAFHQLRVLELGGGMTCLAGLLIAKYTQANFIHLTDGNDLSVQNAHEILSQNATNLTDKVMTSVLKWEHVVGPVQEDAQYDCIISADCLFFDSARTSFINALWTFMKPTGFGLIMAPCRGDTLNTFVQQATQKGFKCQVRKCYNRTIWQKHLELLDTSVYDENIHYPILIEITKLSKQHRVPIIPFT